MKGGTRLTWVYIHRSYSLTLNMYRLFSHGVYTPCVLTHAQQLPRASPLGVYTPLISHRLRRNLRPRPGGGISAQGVYTPKALPLRPVPPIAPLPTRLSIFYFTQTSRSVRSYFEASHKSPPQRKTLQLPDAGAIHPERNRKKREVGLPVSRQICFYIILLIMNVVYF